MIKFFRKIRQRLLTENLTDRQAGRVTKYVLYAIGEIILVVIGILIALQINTWNEYGKDRLEERNYLFGIKEDLQKDLHFLLEIEESLSSRIRGQRVMDSLYSRNLIQEKHINELRVKRYQYAPTTFYSTAGNYNSLVSEGKVSLIQNKGIYNGLQFIYERMYPRLADRGERLDAMAVQITWDHRQNINHGRFTLDYFLKSGYVEDIHRFHGEIGRYLIDLVDELIIYLPEVIEDIEIELNLEN